MGSIMRVIIQPECQNYYQRAFSELHSFLFLLNKQVVYKNGKQEAGQPDTVQGHRDL